MRGGLVGPSPEALNGEAPKGQPVIRREHLVAVRMEAPQGQLMYTDPEPNKSCDDWPEKNLESLE